MVIENVSHINLTHTFDCGQCFRWNLQSCGSYTGVVNGQVVTASLQGSSLVLDGVPDIKNESDIKFWKNYFDLNSDYAKIKNFLNKDKIIKKCIEQSEGIRILRQPPFETLISFIISANNNIPRIKKIIEALCKLHGNKLEQNGKIYYSFPTAETLSTLSTEDLAPIKAGFRDKYIIDAARAVQSGEVVLENIDDILTDELRCSLMKIKGVGKKVADCVLLFGLNRTDVFPQDVWIKRILKEVYNIDSSDIDNFSRTRFGKYGGFAQQYLFYYYRDIAR